MVLTVCGGLAMDFMNLPIMMPLKVLKPISSANRITTATITMIRRLRCLGRADT